MKACTPSSAAPSIMLQAMVCPAAWYAASMPELDLAIEELLAEGDRDPRLGEDAADQRLDLRIERRRAPRRG